MPVWPICFCSCCPIPPAAPMRLPAASTPMSRIDTPPSANAAIAASDARSTVSLSGCMPNFVIWIPRIQTSSPAITSPLSDGFEPEPNRLDTLTINTHRLRCQLDLHPERHVLRIGLHVDHVASHTGTATIHQCGHERHRHPGRGKRHDRERSQLALGRHIDLFEVCGTTSGARIAPIEEPCSTRRTLMGDEMRLIPQYQVVHQRNLTRHDTPSRETPEFEDTLLPWPE